MGALAIIVLVWFPPAPRQPVHWPRAHVLACDQPGRLPRPGIAGRG
jgi:hypothetical protein